MTDVILDPLDPAAEVEVLAGCCGTDHMTVCVAGVPVGGVSPDGEKWLTQTRDATEPEAFDTAQAAAERVADLWREANR